MNKKNVNTPRFLLEASELYDQQRTVRIFCSFLDRPKTSNTILKTLNSHTQFHEENKKKEKRKLSVPNNFIA
jgi:hypothetical protein